MVLQIFGHDNGENPPRTPFHKRLRWLIQNPPEGSVVMEITPEAAAELLKRNKDDDYSNRPLSEPTVAKYVRAMKAGWKLTGETIIVSKAGNLLNGQHRLEACVRSGCAFSSHVVFGIDDDAFAFMDVGRKRSAGDIFAINGVANAGAMAAATLWLWKYVNSGMVKPASWLTPTNDQLYDFYLEHQGLQQSCRAGQRFAQYKLASPAIMTALHFLCAQKNRQMADAFFEQVATGIGFTSSNQPAAKLRQCLIDGRTGAARLPDIYVGAFTVQAWNAARQNKRIGLFRWRGKQNPDQPFPRVA